MNKIMLDKVIVKLEVVMPYGGGMHKSTLLSMPVTKHISDTTMFTVNRSPHGNKTAREQFKIVGTKYNNKIIVNNISNADNLLSHLGGNGVVQGINNTYVRSSIEYTTLYNIRTL